MSGNAGEVCLKPIFSRPSIRVAADGWIVEVTAPVVGAKEPMHRLFAVGVAEENAVEAMMRGGLGTFIAQLWRASVDAD